MATPTNRGSPVPNFSNRCSSRSSSRSCWASSSAWPGRTSRVQAKPLGDGFIKLIKMMIAPHRVLRRRARHRRGRRPQEGRPGRHQGADLLRGRHDHRAGARHRRSPTPSSPGVGMNIDPKHAGRQARWRLHARPRAGVRRRRLRIPAEDHPDHRRRRLRQGRHPAGADRLRSCSAARARASAASARKPVVDFIEPRQRHPLQDHGLHRPAGAARRVRRHRLHGRQIRRRLAEAARHAGAAVLRSAAASSCSSCSAASCGCAGFSIFKLLRYLREELMIVLGTASSRQRAAADHAQARAARHQGFHRRPRHPDRLLVQPRRVLDLPDAGRRSSSPRRPTRRWRSGDLLAILGVALLTSKGAHGVPGSAIVVLAATLAAIRRFPAIGLVLVLSVDWFMGIARALGNMIGNCVATVVDRRLGRRHRPRAGASRAQWRDRSRRRGGRAGLGCRRRRSRAIRFREECTKSRGAFVARRGLTGYDWHVDAADCAPDQSGICAVRRR